MQQMLQIAEQMQLKLSVLLQQSSDSAPSGQTPGVVLARPPPWPGQLAGSHLAAAGQDAPQEDAPGDRRKTKNVVYHV
eukprot:5852538-Heterocapsa_arctica.AAC.1